SSRTSRQTQLHDQPSGGYQRRASFPEQRLPPENGRVVEMILHRDDKHEDPETNPQHGQESPFLALRERVGRIELGQRWRISHASDSMSTGGETTLAWGERDGPLTAVPLRDWRRWSAATFTVASR